MSKGYILVSKELLGGLLKLPEGVRVVGVMSMEDPRGVHVGVIIEGTDLPAARDVMGLCEPVYETTDYGGGARFLYWMGEALDGEGSGVEGVVGG